MKKLLCMAMMAAAAAGPVFAGAPETPSQPEAAPALKEKESARPLSFEASLEAYSAYVWRGNIINDRPVLQPSATLSYDLGAAGCLSADVWANFDLTDRNRSHTGAGLNEIDYSADYEIDLGGFTIGAGHLWYTFPKASGRDYDVSTREFYLSLAYGNDIVTPSAAIYRDYAAADGFYGTVGLNKELAFDRFKVGGDLTLGMADDHYAAYYYGRKADAGFSDVTADVYIGYDLTENLSVGAKLAWTSLLGTDARSSEEAGWDEDLFWGGVNLTAAF